MNYGIKMRELRERHGITQKELAEKLNINDSMYCGYEKEYQIIPLKHLIYIADYFNVSIDYFFSNSNKNTYEDNIKGLDKIKTGQRLKEFRKENKLTQAKLATILNTTQSVIADYEKGRYLIATPFLYTISKKFNISADYLLAKIDNPKYLK